VSLDVGYGQLAVTLRDDPRVTVVERTNFRLVDPSALGEPYDVIAIDASFISVVTILDRARTFLAPGGAIVALVKPQFEAGRERLGSGGVVRDPAVHAAILAEVRDRIVGLGLVPVAVVPSPLVGPAGNVEFFMLVRATGIAFDDEALERALAERPV
jgi:23S rRNA (cytidine1920-2'-O)/16S rRNA (cytidine1409-2'-O)-methyltransferase